MDLSSTPLSLPLRVWPKEDPNETSLPVLIQRINEQKGQFRNVTEQSLEEEIQASTSGDDTVEREGHEHDKSSRNGEDEFGRKETLLSAREDLLKQVGIAYMEAYYALDFVSLLLSKDTPRQAELSMSQHLKQHVPLGSLGAEKVQAQQESPEMIKDQELVCKGWKLQSLNTAADALIKSATRLETEIEQETRYWEEILAIDKKGWALCRLPRERHTLGVRFGFLEAATEFRERGLGALRRGDNGKVILDQGLNNSTPKAIRVRIESKDKTITGSSTIPSVTSPDTSSVEDLILQSRNSVYEEELYHELNREARILTNQGVRIHDSTIVLALPDQQQILIDLIPLTNEASSQDDTTTITTDNKTLAESIALTFRLLLSHAHRQNHYRRTQLPPPLTDRKRPIPPYSILRPVLTHLLHQHTIRSLRKDFQSLLTTLRLANLSARITLEAGTNCSLVAAPNNQSHTPETIISTFANGIESLFHLTLSHRTTQTLQIRTLLYPPVLGTEYLINDPETGNMRFTTSEETKRYIAHITTLSLVSEILSYHPITTQQDDSNVMTDKGDNGGGGAAWRPGSVSNEVVTSSSSFSNTSSTGKGKRLVVFVEFSDEGDRRGGQTMVEVKWGLLDGKLPASTTRTTADASSAVERLGEEKGRYIWVGGRDGGGSGGGRGIRSFREVVEGVLGKSIE